MDDFTFPIVNFLFISINIPTSPAYEVYISQLIPYSRSCAKYSNFLDRTKLLTQKLLETRLRWFYVAVLSTNILRSSSRSGWPLRNIHISIDNESFLFYVDCFLSSITDKSFTGFNYSTYVTRRVSYYYDTHPLTYTTRRTVSENPNQGQHVKRSMFDKFLIEMGKVTIPSKAEFAKFVSSVRHDQQNLGRFC